MRRISNEAAAVLRLFLRDPAARWYGLQMISLIGLPSGTLYPLLIRLEERGVLTSETESVEVAASEGRRPRRYYRLSHSGIAEAEALLRRWEDTTAARRQLLADGPLRHRLA